MRWLIWSNDWHAWWGEAACGATSSVQKAGRYTLAEALKIISKSSYQRAWLTGMADFVPTDLLVPAPEHLPAMIQIEKSRNAETEGDL